MILIAPIAVIDSHHLYFHTHHYPSNHCMETTNLFLFFFIFSFCRFVVNANIAIVVSVVCVLCECADKKMDE